MGAKNRISVMVGKRKIYLEGEKSEQFLNRVQNYYNSLMDKILSETDYNRLDDDLKSALVSFNIIDDLLSAKDALQVAINDNKNKERENYSLNHDLGSLQIKYEALKKQYDDLERKSNYQKIKVESSLITNAKEEITKVTPSNIRQQVLQTAQQRPQQVPSHSMQNIQSTQNAQKVIVQNNQGATRVFSDVQSPQKIEAQKNEMPKEAVQNVQNAVAQRIEPQKVDMQRAEQQRIDAQKVIAQKKNEEFMASINKTFGMSADAQKVAIEKAAQNFSRSVNQTNSAGDQSSNEQNTSGNFPPNYNNALKPL